MIELQGKYNIAKVYTDIIEETAISQIIQLCNQEFTSGSKIRIMPDVHAGAGCTIGTTMTITAKAVPNLVGVDIGCGMLTCEISDKSLNLQKLDKVIKENIPSGFDVRKNSHKFVSRLRLDELRVKKGVNLNRAEKSIGTLGGGNHFIEADRDDDGKLYIVIHTGSRHLGVEIAKYYQDKAFEAIKNDEPAVKSKISHELAYLEGQLFDDYINDMKIAQEFASVNREAILQLIIKGMNITPVRTIETVHNYIDMKTMILRKGAVSADLGEELLIPINMRDGSLFCVGKGNADWNNSAPHGAGRLMSRSDAKNHFTVNEFKKQMDGIYSTTVGKDTLDECPMAYKSIDDIVKNITDTAEIKKVIKPIYNFKAGKE